MRYNRDNIKNKVLVTTCHNDKTVTEKFYPIIKSSLTVNNITYPIQTRNAFKVVEVEYGFYVPNVTLHGDRIISDKPSCGTGINDDNLHMRLFRVDKR